MTRSTLATGTDSHSWAIEPPLSAAFVGAAFWSAAVISFWAACQCDWARARIPIRMIAVVATLILALARFGGDADLGSARGRRVHDLRPRGPRHRRLRVGAPADHVSDGREQPDLAPLAGSGR